MAVQTSKSFMLRPRQLGSTVGWMLVDMAMIFLAYLATLSIRTVKNPFDYGEYATSVHFIACSAFCIIVFFYIFGGYHRIWSMTSGHDITVIIKAFAFAVTLIGIVDLMSVERPLPLTVVVVGNFVAFGLMAGVRYRMRLVRGFSWRWNVLLGGKWPNAISETRVLIVGAGDSGQLLALRLKHYLPKTDQNYRIVGLVDDDKRKLGMFVEGCPILGTRVDIPDLVEGYEVEEIVIAIHNLGGADLRDILSYCNRTKALIKVMPDMTGFMSANDGGMLLRDLKPEDLTGRTAVGRFEGINLGLITNKITLVTGAAGSIGSELCRQLCINNAQRLILLDNNESALYELQNELKATYPGMENRIDWILADISIRESLKVAFTQFHPQIVFHAAAYKHVPVMERYPHDALRVNIGGTYNLIELAQDFEVERFVLISTDKAVDPSCVMGASKRICELLQRALPQRRASKALFTSVRFGNVLGSRGSVVPIFNEQIDRGGPVKVTEKEMRRYFMSIPEAANLVVHAACLTQGDDIFMLKMGEEVRIYDLAERLIRLRGLRPGKDIEIKIVGARPGEKMAEQLHSDGEMPLDTIHPNIMKVMDKENTFDAVSFLNRVDSIMRHGFAPDRVALDQLRDVISTPIPAPRPAERETQEVPIPQGLAAASASV